MSIRAIDHVQLAMPPGEEDRARVFYVDVLGLREVAKPAALAGRGGAWFASGDAAVHLGVEDPFTPARKAHPAFAVDDLDAMIERCRSADVSIDEAVPLEGIRRVYVHDLFGNRIELLERCDD